MQKQLYNIDLERAILNTIILDNAELKKAKSILKPEDFFRIIRIEISSKLDLYS